MSPRRALLLVGIILGVIFLLAHNLPGQTPIIPANPLPVPVTGHFTDSSGAIPASSIQIRFQLANCSGGYPRIYGHNNIVLNQYILQPDGTGAVNGTLWPNAWINCGGFTGQTSWLVTRVINNVPQGIPLCFRVMPQGLNLDQDTPCTQFSAGTNPNSPVDGTWNNGTFLGDLDVYGTSRLHGFVHAYQDMQVDGTVTATTGAFGTLTATTMSAVSASLTSATIQALTAATLHVTGNVAIDGNLSAHLINSTTGYQFAAGSGVVAGQCLVAGSDAAHTFVPGQCYPPLHYQTVMAAGVAQTQRNAINFLSPLTVADNSGNDSSDVGLANTAVTPGSYSYSSITVGADGRITAASSGTPPVALAPVHTGHLLNGSCTTTSTNTYSSCPVTITWDNPFPDTNYKVGCTGIGPNDGRALMQGVISKSTSTMTLLLVTEGNRGITFSDVECLAAEPNQTSGGSTGTGSSTAPQTLYYQALASNGSPLPQRPLLNFGPTLSAIDNSDGNQTQLDLPSLGRGGTTAYPSSITIDAQGRVTSVAAGSAPTTPTPGGGATRTCNGAGCYVIDANGTIWQWLRGNIESDTSSGSNPPQTLTLPTACPSTVLSVLVSSVVPTRTSDDTHGPNEVAVNWTNSSVTTQRYRLADHGSDSSYPSVQVTCY